LPTADSLRFHLVDHVLLVVHADCPPDDGDWQRMALVRDANRLKIRGTLVVAPPRASISAEQRASVARFLKENDARAAVLTDSALIRGVALAVGLFGVQVRAFAPSSLVSALDYLQFSQARHAEMARLVESLKKQLSHPQTVPPAVA